VAPSTGAVAVCRGSGRGERLVDDLVVCVLRGGFSRVEKTSLDGGRGHAVIQQRMEFQEVLIYRIG